MDQKASNTVINNKSAINKSKISKPSYNIQADLAAKKKINQQGHRERVRQRFLSGGLDGFADHEVLEMLLFYTINRIDTKDIAKDLIKEFGSLEKVFNGSQERLVKAIAKDIRPSKQECEKSALLIRFIRQIAGLLWRRNAIAVKVSISNGAELLKYLEAEMKDLNEEQLRIIFLDSSNKIIKDETFSKGIENQTAVYPRAIVKRALEVNAISIIVVHNHPAGTLKPSNADISITRQLQTACDALGISLLDHLIIGDRFNSEDQQKGFYSFAENGLL